MSNFVNQLKLEIGRIARKEVRSETETLKKGSSQHRAEIAALKRRVAALEAALKKAIPKLEKRTSKMEQSKEPVALRFRHTGFANMREKLGLTAAEMATLLGASAQSVYNWESGKSKPQAAQLAAISEIRKMGKKLVMAKLEEISAKS